MICQDFIFHCKIDTSQLYSTDWKEILQCINTPQEMSLWWYLFQMPDNEILSPLWRKEFQKSFKRELWVSKLTYTHPHTHKQTCTHIKLLCLTCSDVSQWSCRAVVTPLLLLEGLAQCWNVLVQPSHLFDFYIEEALQGSKVPSWTGNAKKRPDTYIRLYWG